MSEYSLEVSGLTKVFGRRLIFRGINLKISKPGIYGISGINGSGKSTFVKIIAGLLASSEGKVQHQLNGKTAEDTALPGLIGMASPYLVLYDEFTAEENIDFFSKVRGGKFKPERMQNLFAHFGLTDRKDELLKTYSSGMKQRVKFIFALQHEPEILILDEPVSNLDNAGKSQIYDTISDYAKSKVVMIASNEESDLALCSEIVYLGDYKNESSEAKR